MTRPYTKRDVLERFMSKVEITDDCWIWLRNLNENGYPTFNPSYGVKRYAYRWVYEAVVEPIPEGLTLDHLCENPPCVNPDHLEVVTHGENSRRARLRRTTCKNGHEWSEENTYRRKDGGTRQCKTCAHERYLAQKIRFQSDDLTRGCPGHIGSKANQPTPSAAALV